MKNIRWDIFLVVVLALLSVSLFISSVSSVASAFYLLFAPATYTNSYIVICIVCSVIAALLVIGACIFNVIKFTSNKQKMDRFATIFDIVTCGCLLLLSLITITSEFSIMFFVQFVYALLVLLILDMPQMKEWKNKEVVEYHFETEPAPTREEIEQKNKENVEEDEK